MIWRDHEIHSTILWNNRKQCVWWLKLVYTLCFLSFFLEILEILQICFFSHRSRLISELTNLPGWAQRLEQRCPSIMAPGSGWQRSGSRLANDTTPYRSSLIEPPVHVPCGWSLMILTVCTFGVCGWSLWWYWQFVPSVHVGGVCGDIDSSNNFMLTSLGIKSILGYGQMKAAHYN